MTDEIEAMEAAILAELERQHREGDERPYLYDSCNPGLIGVDGYVDTKALANAVLAARQPDLVPGLERAREIASLYGVGKAGVLTSEKIKDAITAEIAKATEAEGG